MLVRPSEPHVISVIFLMSSVLQRFEDNGSLSHLHKASQPLPLPMSCDPDVPCSSGSLFSPRLGSVVPPAFQGWSVAYWIPMGLSFCHLVQGALCRWYHGNWLGGGVTPVMAELGHPSPSVFQAWDTQSLFLGTRSRPSTTKDSKLNFSAWSPMSLVTP